MPERIVDLRDIALTGSGWHTAVGGNSLLMSRDAGNAQIYALEWVAP
jgi:hypothetical protein